MRIIFIILTLLYLFLGVSPVFAISFTISNPQQSGDKVTVDVFLSGLTSSSCLNGSCYLQAAFTSPTPIRYFGFTKNNTGQWYEYTGSLTQSYIQSTFFSFQPVSGTWSGQLTIKINTEDPDYHGPGTYDVKAWRYSGNSNSYAGDPATLTINVAGSTLTPTPTPIPTPTPTPSPSPTLKPSATPTPTPKKSSTSSPTPTPSLKPSPTYSPTITPLPTKSTFNQAAVAGVSKSAISSNSSASSSANIKIADQKQFNPFILVGIIFIIGGVGSLGYIFLYRNEAIHKYFRRRN